MTAYQRHVSEWKDCDGCNLSTGRTKVVFARGRIPCDILFVGEAPGASEDLLGKPFIGPAGKLLDRIVENGLRQKYRVAFTNLVGCIPIDETGKGQPSSQDIKACSRKLSELVCIASPKAIVCVGLLAAKHVRRDGMINFTEIIHPAAILRMDVSQQGLAIQRCIVALQDLSENLS